MWPLPEGLDEAAFAGLIRGTPSRFVRAASISMDVPADADFILEGVVPAGERRVEGPFGDHYGHYSHAAPFPVFRVRKVTRRRDPIYLAAVVGKPPQEDMYLGNPCRRFSCRSSA
jgi:4-hydroxy-3-polyprenylbenzoate decarboxylase